MNSDSITIAIWNAARVIFEMTERIAINIAIIIITIIIIIVIAIAWVGHAWKGTADDQN